MLLDIALTDDFLAWLNEYQLPFGWKWDIDIDNHTAVCSRIEFQGEQMHVKAVKFINEQCIALYLNTELLQSTPTSLPSHLQTMDLGLLKAIISNFDAQKVCKGISGVKSILKFAKNCSAALVMKKEMIKATNCMGVTNVGDVCAKCGRLRSYLLSRIKLKPTSTSHNKIQSLKRAQRVLMKENQVG